MKKDGECYFSYLPHKGQAKKSHTKGFRQAYDSKPSTQEEHVLYKKISLNNTSDILRSFVREMIAFCVNEEAFKGRIYKLTQNGQNKRLELLEEDNGSQKDRIN